MALNEVKMEAKAEQRKRNQCSPLALLSGSAVKGGKDPGDPGVSRSAWKGGREHGTLDVNYYRKEQTASSSRKFSSRRFMSSGVQKHSEEPLELWSCVRRSLFPPSSPAWAHWAGARIF